MIATDLFWCGVPGDLSGAGPVDNLVGGIAWAKRKSQLFANVPWSTAMRDGWWMAGWIADGGWMWMDGWIDGREMDGWTDGWMDGWMGGKCVSAARAHVRASPGTCWGRLAPNAGDARHAGDARNTGASESAGDEATQAGCCIFTVFCELTIVYLGPSLSQLLELGIADFLFGDLHFFTYRRQLFRWPNGETLQFGWDSPILA